MSKPKARTVRLNYVPHSQKAIDFHFAWRTPTRILSGAQGSGKSYACIYEIIDHLLFNPKFRGKKALVVGVNATVVREQIFKSFLDMMTCYDKKGVNVGLREGIDYEKSLQPLKIEFSNGSSINFLSLESGVNLRSWSVSIVYADDLGLQDETAWNTLCDRAREEPDGVNMKLANCNPQGPSHWLYQRYFKSVVEDGVMPEYTYLDTWTIFDNKPLEARIPEVMARYAYSPVETRRRIYGEWISNEGLVYTNFDRMRHVVKRDITQGYYAPGEDEDPFRTFSFLKDARIFGGMDFGVLQGTGLLYVAEHEGKYYVFKEYFSNRANDTTATHSAYIHRQPWHVQKIYVDHAPELLNNYIALRHTNMVMAPKGAGSIQQGIDTIQKLFFEDRLFISADCKRLIKELESYAYKGDTEKPLDKDICLVDALRYVMTPLAGKKSDLFFYSAASDALPQTIAATEPAYIFKSPPVRGKCIGFTTAGVPVYEELA